MCAWVAPRLYIVGEQISASILNIHIRDNLTHLGGTHAHQGGTGSGAPLDGLDEIAFQDQSGSPSDGTLQRNGTGLEWHDGASAIVVTIRDVAAGTVALRQTGSADGTTMADGTHAHV